MSLYEQTYAQMVDCVLQHGEKRQTRNGFTRSMFGMFLRVSSLRRHEMPLLQGRQMFTRGILGELAAILRQPKTNGDFVEHGCNYWKKWADADGSLRVDYGNAWFNFNGYDQVAELKRMLKHDPTNRRMIITGWNPSNLANLSLPCCHLYYQFYVENNRLHMLWVQRSADLMIGVPSDVVFASAWLLAICNEFGFEPGDIVMQLGDVHIYEEHIPQANEYLVNAERMIDTKPPVFAYVGEQGKDFCLFEPSDLMMLHYTHCAPINFLLKE